MTQDEQDQFDLYQHYIELAVAAETEATAAMSTYQTQMALARDWRAQAKVIATNLGIT